jgi:hypothetical protein
MFDSILAIAAREQLRHLHYETRINLMLLENSNSNTIANNIVRVCVINLQSMVNEIDAGYCKTVVVGCKFL